MGGVDLQVGQVDDRTEQLRFVMNRFGQGAVLVGQRMTATGFREALEQGFRVGVEVEHVALDVASADFLQQLRKALELARQIACVNGYRNQRMQQFGMQQRALGQLRQQSCGEVVDAVEAVVFENVEGCALARTGAAADDD